MLFAQWHNKNPYREDAKSRRQSSLPATSERNGSLSAAPPTPPAGNVKRQNGGPVSSYIEIFRDHARTARFHHLDQVWRNRRRYGLTGSSPSTGTSTRAYNGSHGYPFASVIRSLLALLSIVRLEIATIIQSGGQVDNYGSSLLSVRILLPKRMAKMPDSPITDPFPQQHLRPIGYSRTVRNWS